MALQVVLARLLKKLISLKKEEQSRTMSTKTLTIREQDIIHCMSGYIPVKLINKFKKPSPNDATQKKHQMFVHVLRGMKVDVQTDGIDTLEDYTRVWTEQIDRGRGAIQN